MNKLRSSIKTQTFYIILILSIILTIFSIFQTVRWSKVNYEELIDAKLSTIIILTQELIGEDFHNSIVDKNSVTNKEFTDISNKLSHICSKFNLENIWSVMLINDKFVLTTISSSIKKYDPKDHKFFEILPHQETFNEIKLNATKARVSRNNKTGNYEAIMIPFVDSKGRSYIWGASYGANEYSTQIIEYRNKQLIINLSFIAILIFFIYLSIRFLTKPLTFITSNIQKIATGKIDYNKKNWSKEYYNLSKNINVVYSEINNIYQTISMQEKNLRTTLMCIGDGVIVADKDGLITRFNKEAIKLTGWEKNEALGKSLLTIFNIYDSKTSKNIKDLFTSVISSGKTIELSRSTMLISKDNTEYHISGVFAPISIDNNIIGTVISFKNLTSEDKQADKIKQNHEIMLEILKLSKIAYWEYNVSDDTFWISKDIVKLFGVNEVSEGLIDGNLFITKYLNNNATYNIYDEINDAIINKQPARFIHEVINIKTNQPLFYDAAATPILNSEGDVKKLIGLTKDITEHKSLTHQLYHSQKLDAVGQLAGGVAHDFNNMLGGIIGFAELLLNNIKDDEKLQSYCNNIINTSENAAALTSQLLSFARKGKSSSTPISIHKSIESAVTLLKRSIDKSIDIKTNFNAKVDTVIGDPSQIESVIINLGVNSRDAIHDNGTITIITELTELSESFCKLSQYDVEPGNYIVIKIIDNGCGMSGDTLEHIFEPFFTTKGEGKGTGLGLSVIHGIITSYKGFINAYSELGKGSEFKIYLPLNCQDIIPKEVTDIHSSNYFGNEGVLLVDDEVTIRTMSKALLEDLGYTVFTAENGANALEVYNEYKSKISIVILDVVMPVMGGMECLKKLKLINPDIKVIIASGFSKSETSSDFIKNGALKFIDKPYRQITLAKSIKDALKQ